VGTPAGSLRRTDGGPAEVTLRRPPPLERPLSVDRAGDAVRLLYEDAVVAEGRSVPVDVGAPPAVSLDEAEHATARYAGSDRHEFPTCFVCGPARAEGDGLRVFAGPTGVDGVVAAPWRPDDVSSELVWAALDCPGAFAVGFAERGATVLGRMAADVTALPAVGEPHVVVAWPLGDDGRKLYAATALLDAVGRVLARARQTWIVPR
jgi:hypothetical protein